MFLGRVAYAWLLFWKNSSAPARPSTTLQAYNIDPASVSVSGFSAGGFMAAQLGIAYSSVFPAGFGIFAGGPYDCARNQDFSTVCLGNHTPSIDIPLQNMRSWGPQGLIDPLHDLENRRVYLQAGRRDGVVGLATSRQLERQLSFFVSKDDMVFVELPEAAHAFPSYFDRPGNSDCGIDAAPYIANCKYDGAGAVLQWLYHDDLKIPVSDTSTGIVKHFDQTGPHGALGLAQSGFIYVPPHCEDKRGHCKLHIALHGCTMSYEQIGDRFLYNTGYLRWAEANSIVLLFPQATVDTTPREIWNGTEFSGGALACFDWVGWVGNNADQKGGVQMLAIVNMVETLLGTSLSNQSRR